MNRRWGSLCSRLFLVANVLSLSGGCHHSGVAPSSTLAKSRLDAPSPAAPARDAWVAAAMPLGVGNSWISAELIPGERRMASGAYRAVVRTESVELASELLADWISLPFLFRDTWYFVTDGGDIFSAPTFLGHLTATGLVVGAGVLLSAQAPERVLLLDRNHGLWSFTGSTATRMNPPAPGIATSLIEGANGRPLVGICEQLFSVRADGTFEPLPPAISDPRSQAAADTEDMVQVSALMTRFEAALRARQWTWNVFFALEGTVMLHDGSLVRREKVMPPGREDCSILQAGLESLVYCPPMGLSRRDEEEMDAPPGTVFRLSAAGRVERWIDVPSHAEPEAGPGPSLLAHDYFSDIWIHAGKRDVLNGRTRNLNCVSDYESRILGLSGKWVLIARRCDEKLSFALADLTSQNEFDELENHPVAEFIPGGAQIEDAGLSADQRAMWVFFHNRSNQPAVAIGPVGGMLKVEVLPKHARGVAFTDASRGVAIGNHLGQVWSTLDGAAHWSRLTFPTIQGDPAVVRLRGDLACNLVACGSASFVWAHPRALVEVGYKPWPLVAPPHVPTDRVYVAPVSRWNRVAHDRDEYEGCPQMRPKG